MIEALFFQETNSGLFIKAVGHITASLSVDLRILVMDRLDRLPVPVDVYADLSECSYMDSTFMGLLVGFHKKMKGMTGHPLSLINPSLECERLLRGLGIWKLMRVVDGSSDQPQFWTLVTKNASPNPSVILEAHQELSSISSENAQKFAVLEDLLKNQIKNNPADD